MASAQVVPTQQYRDQPLRPSSTGSRFLVSGVAGVEVKRGGRIEPFIHSHPVHSSAAVGWTAIAVEEHTTPACVIPQHEHIENFLHIVLQGSVKCEVLTQGKILQFDANPGTTFILPRGTIDEVRWKGPTHRIAVAIHQSLLTNALDETSHQNDIELTEHWNLQDPHIQAVLLAMKIDLNEGSPAGRLYGESLSNALAVYLLGRYSAHSYAPVTNKGGLPGYRLKRVLDYISANLADDLTLSELAAISNMSPHYFSELFKKSMGVSPHRYLLSQRIERSKQSLCNHRRSIIEAGLEAGFQNPSHFARVFRKFVGTSPSNFQSEMQIKSRAVADYSPAPTNKN
jgi:AraC family transcriptional regulator